MKTNLTATEVLHLAGHLFNTMPKINDPLSLLKVYPIPRGGVPALFALLCQSTGIVQANSPDEADFFIDDIIDSGSTMQLWCDRYPGKPFYALIDKTDADCQYRDKWVVFPWESDTQNSEDDSIVGTLINRIKISGAPFLANDNISEFFHSSLEMTLLREEIEKRAEHFLRGLIIDIDNDHNTAGTAERMAKMYLNEIFRGRYFSAPELTSFPNSKGLDEMYMTGPITVRSTCSHHFVPIIGKAWIGVVPGEKVIGLSKFNRIVEWFGRRGQIQEEFVIQVADYLEEVIKPKGLAVVIEATHTCMTCRGVQESMDAKMTTNVMRGVFRDKPEARAEFMTLVAKS